MGDTVLIEERNGVAWVTLNRPDVFNALNTKMVEELVQGLRNAEESKDIGVVVITGAGKAFCAGGDLVEISALGSASIHERRAYLSRFREMILTIRSISKPVIAAVNGYCIGGGNELNLACDLSIASENAKFGQAGPKVGSVPLMGATQLLPLLVGEKKAKEIVFLCRTYTAQEALSMGWINCVVPHNRLMEETEKWCGELLAMSPTSLALAKRGLNIFFNLAYQSLEDGLEALSLFWGTEESREGIRAFKEKRKPEFRKFL